MTRRYLTVDDLAELLQVSKATLYQWRHLGKGPRAVRMGKHLRWSEDEVTRWCEENTDAQRVVG